MAPGRSSAAFLFTTAAAERPHWQARFAPNDYLLFGSETRGAPEVAHEWVRRRFGDDSRVSLPMLAEARSINLAAAVSAGCFEAIRQCAIAEVAQR